MFVHQNPMADMKISASSALAQDLRSQHAVRAQLPSTEPFLPGRAADSYPYTQSNYDSNTNGMPSDGRYLYHPHPAMAYEYSTYPPAPYDPAHYPPNQPPPQRPMPPPNYHPQYPPPPHPHYGVAAQQWTPETWAHYAYSQPPPPPMQDHNLSSGSARPETSSTVPMDPSRYSAPTRPSESSISGANQPLPHPQSGSSHERSKPQTNDPPPPTPPVTSAIDFMKIVDSYRLIIDSSGTFANDTLSNAQGRPPPSEVMDRMLASASLSFRMMETALKEVDGRKLENGIAAEQNGNTSGNATTPVAPTTAKPSDPPQVHEGQTCLGCKATSTPEWRRGPMGPRTLCNACGLVYAKLIKKRGREARAARANGKPPSKTDPDNMNELLSGEDGGSDDEDDDDEFSADDG